MSTVTIGTSTRSLRLSASRNTGVSVIVSRTYRPTPTSSELARNGRRQPKAKNCSSVSIVESRRKMPPEKRNPIGAPSCGNMPYQARLPGGAFSTASSTAPPHSPPRPSPWPKRQIASSSGAARPIVA